MYLRLVRFKVSPGKSAETRDFYQNRVLPQLKQVGGCLFATLTEGLSQPNECVSLTLWDSLECIRRYEEIGGFRELMEASDSLFAESGEWRVQLSDDLTLDYCPAKQAPKVSAYRLDAPMEAQDLVGVQTRDAPLRLVRLNVASENIAAVAESYSQELIPTLRGVRGFLFACLLSNLEADNQLASVTIWASREDAERFEGSDVFKQAMARGREIVGARTWDLMLEAQGAGRGGAGSGMSSRGYHPVAGQDLGK